MILFKEKFYYEISIQREDEQERFIILKSVIQGQPIILVNIYPQKTSAPVSKNFKNSLMN